MSKQVISIALLLVLLSVHNSIDSKNARMVSDKEYLDYFLTQTSSQSSKGVQTGFDQIQGYLDSLLNEYKDDLKASKATYKGKESFFKVEKAKAKKQIKDLKQEIPTYCTKFDKFNKIVKVYRNKIKGLEQRIKVHQIKIKQIKADVEIQKKDNHWMKTLLTEIQSPYFKIKKYIASRKLLSALEIKTMTFELKQNVKHAEQLLKSLQDIASKDVSSMVKKNIENGIAEAEMILKRLTEMEKNPKVQIHLSNFEKFKKQIETDLNSSRLSNSEQEIGNNASRIETLRDDMKLIKEQIEKYKKLKENQFKDLEILRKDFNVTEAMLKSHDKNTAKELGDLKALIQDSEDSFKVIKTLNQYFGDNFSSLSDYVKTKYATVEVSVKPKASKKNAVKSKSVPKKTKSSKKSNKKAAKQSTTNSKSNLKNAKT